ncbi:MAG: acyl--CoA ligase [Acidimicrobiales bacterium]|nr:acyl--CoA ligase [Acidimicrobiales bacterium]
MPSVTDLVALFTQQWDALTAPGAKYAMSETEVGGVPMRVFEAAPGNMRDIWAFTAGYGDARYLVFEDEQLSFSEAHAAVRSLAAALVKAGVQPGDRVAVAMRNYPEWVLSYWATISTGAAVVGMNAWWTTKEMEYALSDSEPKVLICDDERLERVLPIFDALHGGFGLDLISVRSDRDLPAGSRRWDDVVSIDDAPEALPAVAIDPDDDMCIFYTSGTTGSPKGAQLTHRGSVHNLLHIAFMQDIPKEMAAAQGIDVAALEAAAPQPCVMAPTPLFHVTANNCLLHPATAIGGAVVLTHRWDPSRALELIEREKVTSFSGVPTMSRELVNHPEWSSRDTSSLQAMGGGGAAFQPDLVAKIGDALEAGVPSTGYGLTETHGIVTANNSSMYLAKPASCGPIVPTCDAQVRDEMGNELPTGEAGVLWVKGPVIIKGYLNQPEATAEAIQDGWFNTGDIAYIDDDGFVFIVDRAKDMVLRGGENIYCSEVESAIYEHPAVAEAAVFGVPDDRLGEEVGMAVVCQAGASMTEEEARAFLGDRIAGYKIPRYFWFLDEALPRNANGKFVKRTLKEQLVASLS